jgi:AcrR family transcriptional regulator
LLKVRWVTRGRPLEYHSEQVIDAAMKLFWHNGYEATSMQELVGAMGLARSSLYQAFGSKSQLFLTCLDRYQEATALDLTSRLESATTGRAFIEGTLLWAIAEAAEPADPKG